MIMFKVLRTLGGRAWSARQGKGHAGGGVGPGQSEVCVVGEASRWVELGGGGSFVVFCRWHCKMSVPEHLPGAQPWTSCWILSSTCQPHSGPTTPHDNPTLADFSFHFTGGLREGTGPVCCRMAGLAALPQGSLFAVQIIPTYSVGETWHILW